LDDFNDFPYETIIPRIPRARSQGSVVIIYPGDCRNSAPSLAPEIFTVTAAAPRFAAR
jgi:hypothetical protein